MEKNRNRETRLVLEIALHHHLLIDDLDGHVMAARVVDGQFDLGEGAFSDRLPELVLPYVADGGHFLPQQNCMISPLSSSVSQLLVAVPVVFGRRYPPPPSCRDVRPKKKKKKMQSSGIPLRSLQVFLISRASPILAEMGSDRIYLAHRLPRDCHAFMALMFRGKIQR